MSVYLIEYKTPLTQRSAVVHATDMRQALVKFLEDIDEKEHWTISLRIEGIREIK